jgi:hypothetical protein
MGQHVEAFHYAKRHLEISRDTGDRMGQATAQLNLSELSRTLGFTPADTAELPHDRKVDPAVEAAEAAEAKKSRRISMEQMDLIKMTPDAKKAAAARAAKAANNDKENKSNLNKSGLLDEEDFFDFISRFQSKRMDDQRCSLSVPNTKGEIFFERSGGGNCGVESLYQRPDISLFEDIISYPYQGPNKGYYILSLSGQKKDMDIYPLSKNLPALSQFLKSRKPDLVALQHTSPRLFTGSN